MKAVSVLITVSLFLNAVNANFDYHCEIERLPWKKIWTSRDYDDKITVAKPFNINSIAHFTVLPDPDGVFMLPTFMDRGIYKNRCDGNFGVILKGVVYCLMYYNALVFLLNERGRMTSVLDMNFLKEKEDKVMTIRVHLFNNNNLEKPQMMTEQEFQFWGDKTIRCTDDNMQLCAPFDEEQLSESSNSKVHFVNNFRWVEKILGNPVLFFRTTDQSYKWEREVEITEREWYVTYSIAMDDSPLELLSDIDTNKICRTAADVTYRLFEF